MSMKVRNQAISRIKRCLTRQDKPSQRLQVMQALWNLRHDPDYREWFNKVVETWPDFANWMDRQRKANAWKEARHKELNANRFSASGRAPATRRNVLNRPDGLNPSELSGLFLSSFLLNQFDLRAMQAKRSYLEYSNFSHSNLKWSDLSSARLSSCKFNRSDLMGANLSGSDMENAQCSHVSFKNANLSDVNLSGASLLSCDFSGANLTGAQFLHANFRFSKYDDNTQFPDGFRPRAQGMIKS